MATHRKGGPSASPILVRAVELLEDGQWHNYADLVRVLSKMVEPGRAMRRAERVRAAGGPPERYRAVEDYRLIQSGQRSIVRDFLIKKYFEIKPPGRPVDGGEERVIRMVRVPSRIARDRELAERGRLMNPRVLVPLLLNGESVDDHLRDVTLKQAIRLVKVMVAMMVEQREAQVPVETVPTVETVPPVVDTIAAARTSLREQAVVLLADHEWHDFEGVVAELSAIVPRDVALRKAELRRKHGGTRAPDRVLAVDQEQLVRNGSRAIVREILTDSGLAEVVPPGRPGRARQRQPRRVRLI